MKKINLALLTTVLGFILSFNTVQASEGRAQALLYNQAFTDQVDVFTFPQLLPEYAGIYFHLPPVATNVFGGVILDFDQSALGIFIHRPLADTIDQFRLLASDLGAGAPLGAALGDANAATQAHLPGQFFDIIYGNGKWGMSLRTFLWSEVSTQMPPLADPAETTSAFTMVLNGGYKTSPEFNIRGKFGIRHLVDTSTTMSFRFGCRYLEAGRPKFGKVFSSELELGMHMPDGGDSTIAVAIPVKYGIMYTIIPERFNLSLLGGIDLQMVSAPDSDFRFSMVLPIIETAVEYTPLDWLQIRSAIKGGYGIQLGGDPAENTPKFEQLAFSTGLGLNLGNFHIDGVIQYQLWQNGPYFIGGVAGLFAGVSLSYNWGENNLTVTSPEEIKPITPPKPTPTPAPAPKAEPVKTPKDTPAKKTKKTASKETKKKKWFIF
jgi:hypothetical protein